jgi:hypothetical protein
MVQIVPPADWKPRPAEPVKAAAVPEKPTPAPLPEPDPGHAEAADEPAPPPPPPAKKPKHPAPPPVVAASAAVPPPPPVRSMPGVEGETVAEPEAMPLSPVGTSPAELFWHKWLLLGMIPVASVVLIAGIWSIIPSPKATEPAAVPVTTPTAQPVATVDKPPAKEPGKPPESPLVKLNRRWLPEDTRLLVNLRLAAFAGRAEFVPAVSMVASAWEPSVGQVLKAFGLRPETVEQVTWTSTSLADWPSHSVVVIQLGPKQDASPLRSLGEPVPLELDGAPCRRLTHGWTHPFAVLDAQTIVTGQEELLKQLTEGEKRLKCAAIDRFLRGAAPGSDLVGFVDLAAARQTAGRLPTTLMDVWPAGRKAWHVLWESPQSLGVTWRWTDRTTSELALLCEGETAAAQVQAAISELVTAAKPALNARLQSPAQKPGSGQYDLLLKQTIAVLQATRWQAGEGTVWVRTDWGPTSAELLKAIVDSRPAIEADWLQVALSASETNARQLWAGLDGYRQAEGNFPQGANGGALLPPETRLSWIATLLPYYGHRDWHGELQFGYSWNSHQNRQVTRRPLEPAINPSLGPGVTEAGFPVTHFVGLAGVGADAAELKPDDPRAGVFGFNRTTRPQEIADGASNTIATVGVARRLGAWAAGGDATVRAFTKQPYVNGPDGFGTGQPNGMLVGMADGAVRFVSKDVDPTVLEQLATTRGKETVTVAALGTKPTAEPALAAKPAAPETATAEEKTVPTPQKPADKMPAPVQPVAKGPQVPAVDVEAQLAAPVGALNIPGISLRGAIQLVSQMSGVPITLDLDAFAQLGVTLDDQVEIKLSKTTLKTVLETIVSSKRLAFTVEQGQILVTAPAADRNTLKQFRYTVADLTAKHPDSAAELVGMVEKLVAPDSWKAAGGRGTIQADGDALVVVQTAAVHEQLLAFCEKLRVARGRPLQSHYDPSRFALATKTAQARAKLDHPLTLNFAEPTPLVRIAADLERPSGMRILVNWLAICSAGGSPQIAGTLKAHDQPLSQALDGLLQPLGLVYRVVDAETLEITTAKANNARLELEFYPIGKLLDKGQTLASLTERIVSEVAQGSWGEAGGSGVLAFDEPSRCLLVLQPQPVQTLLEAALARWQGGKK